MNNFSHVHKHYTCITTEMTLRVCLQALLHYCWVSVVRLPQEWPTCLGRGSYTETWQPGTYWSLMRKCARSVLMFIACHKSLRLYLSLLPDCWLWHVSSSARHWLLCLSWRENPCEMDSSRGSPLQEVLDCQWRVELWSSPLRDMVSGGKAIQLDDPYGGPHDWPFVVIVRCLFRCTKRLSQDIASLPHLDVLELSIRLWSTAGKTGL